MSGTGTLSQTSHLRIPLFSIPSAVLVDINYSALMALAVTLLSHTVAANEHWLLCDVGCCCCFLIVH